MRLSESRIRRIIREELVKEGNRRAVAAGQAWVEWSLTRWSGRSLNEGSGDGGDIELRAINGRVVARMLRDSGEPLLASLIMNSDRPGASEYIWDQILKQGKESQRHWTIDLPLENVVHRGMSLHDMGFRNCEIVVTVGLTFGAAPIYDFHERISGEVRIDVDFFADDRFGKRLRLGELRQGGLRSSGKFSPPPSSLSDVQHASFAAQDVDIGYLDHLVARREAAMYI